MEIKLLNINTEEFNNLNILIKASKITGILNNNLLPDIILKNKNYTGTILINDLDINQYNLNLISYVKLDKLYLTKYVKDEFYLQLSKLKIDSNSYLSKIESILSLVGLDNTYLNKEIKNLSTSETYLLNLSLNLIIDPDIIILELSNDLDKNNKLLIKNILLDLKRKYKKTIIIISNDINILYELTDYLIIFKDNKMVINDKTNIVFNDKEFLNNNNIELPDLVSFSNKARNYNIKLKNYKDIKDLIKEVYKNVWENKKTT